MEGTIRTRRVGTTPQRAARKKIKKDHTVIRAKNPQHVMDFTSLSWFDSYPLEQSRFTVKEAAQIIMLSLPNCIKMLCGELQETVKLPVPSLARR